METTNIVDFARRDGMTDALTDLLRTGAQQLIATAVEAELASYLAQFSDLRTETGHAAGRARCDGRPSAQSLVVGWLFGSTGSW